VIVPTYEYTNEEHGIRIDVRMPVDARTDTIVLTRRTVPSRITVGVGAQPPTHGERLLKDYKRLEDTGQLSDHPNYLSPAQVKAAAALPEV
jgi:hypothetical protein